MRLKKHTGSIEIYASYPLVSVQSATRQDKDEWWGLPSKTWNLLSLSENLHLGIIQTRIQTIPRQLSASRRSTMPIRSLMMRIRGRSMMSMAPWAFMWLSSLEKTVLNSTSSCLNAGSRWEASLCLYFVSFCQHTCPLLMGQMWFDLDCYFGWGKDSVASLKVFWRYEDESEKSSW